MNVRRAIAVALAGALVGALALSLGGGAAVAKKKSKTVKLTASLSGQNNIPVGDPDGSGNAVIKLKKKSGQVCFNITFSGIEDPIAGHIHQGDSSVASGPIVVPFFGGAVGSPSPVKGCVDAAKSLIKKIAKDPQGYYVNLHTPTYPDGAIRGQLKGKHSSGGSTGGNTGGGGVGGYTY